MNQLKEFREEAGMTVRELSERSGVSEDTITKIENGHRKGRSMTLRKLAKALGVRPYQLSPEHFERAAEAEDRAPDILTGHNFFSFEAAGAHSPMTEVDQDADILSEGISRVYEVMRAIDQLVEKSPRQPSYPDGVPRMNISERQQKVLITVLECGLVDPSTVADRLEISVSTAYRDLSVLEEHGLVMADESGKRLISPLGSDLAEAIVKGLISPSGGDVVETVVNTRSSLRLDEALSQILTLMKVYDSVAEFDPYRASGEDAISFFRLQELIFQSIQRIVTVTEPTPLVTMTEPSPRTTQLRQVIAGYLLGLPQVEQKDAEDYAQVVQSVMRQLMTDPPALNRIREDIRGVSWQQIVAALDAVLVAQGAGYGDADLYKNFRWNLKRPTRTSSTLRYGTVQRDETDSAQQARMRDTD